MALTLTALQTEVYARGFDYLNDSGTGTTRVTRWINDAMHFIDELEDWPYLETSTTGTAPLTVSDMRKVAGVYDVGNQVRLDRRSRGEMADTFVDLTTTGQPVSYYVTSGTTINVYPANTSTTLTVYYWKFGSDLPSGSDAPLMPDRFRYAIVEFAVAKGLQDAEDFAGAQAAIQAGNAIVDQMRQWAAFLQPQISFVPVVGDDC